MNNNLQVYLEKELIRFYPETYLSKYIKTTIDVYENRALLKEILFDDDSIEYLTKIIIRDIDNNSKFKKKECLFVIKRLVKNINRTHPRRFKPSLVKSFFYLYKAFIFSNNEVLQWCVSVLIRDQILDDEDLNWLISNYQKSEHIVNRLLRYPDKNKLVKLWAAKVYLKRELISRNSELIGILIEEDIPGFVDTSDTSEVIWGIYYAKCSEKIKYQLIIKYMDMVSVKEVVKVAIRLSCSEIIEKLLDKSKSLGII